MLNEHAHPAVPVRRLLRSLVAAVAAGLLTSAPDGKSVWAGSETDTRIFKINMGALALTGSGRYVYIQDFTWPGEGRTGSISLVDTSTYRVLHHIVTGILPEGLAIDTKRDIAYALTTTTTPSPAFASLGSTTFRTGVPAPPARRPASRTRKHHNGSLG